jgi:hypothetical protein
MFNWLIVMMWCRESKKKQAKRIQTNIRDVLSKAERNTAALITPFIITLTTKKKKILRRFCFHIFLVFFKFVMFSLP